MLDALALHLSNSDRLPRASWERSLTTLLCGGVHGPSSPLARTRLVVLAVEWNDWKSILREASELAACV